MSDATARAAAPACSRRPGWWNASTVVSPHSARASTPPSPACCTMSSSCHASSAATARSASRFSCRTPGNVVPRVDRRTGTQRAGSAQSHTTPRAQGCIVSWPSTRVGTAGTSTSSPPARARSAATAASASRIHPST
eukprot:286914-Pleurochrysis_carterae.AAC.1